MRRWQSAFFMVPVVMATPLKADVLRRLRQLQTVAEVPLGREEAAQTAELHPPPKASKRAFLEPVTG